LRGSAPPLDGVTSMRFVPILAFAISILMTTENPAAEPTAPEHGTVAFAPLPEKNTPPM